LPDLSRALKQNIIFFLSTEYDVYLSFSELSLIIPGLYFFFNLIDLGSSL